MADILIVDDSQFMRKMLSDILVKNKHKIIGEAENAKEAMESCEKLKPDIVTLDILMPEIENTNAISLLKEINQKYPKTTVIVVSAMGLEHVVQEYIKNGAHDFITKPFQPDQITQAVDQALLKNI